jgi:hypothetical protein
MEEGLAVSRPYRIGALARRRRPLGADAVDTRSHPINNRRSAARRDAERRGDMRIGLESHGISASGAMRKSPHWLKGQEPASPAVKRLAMSELFKCEQDPNTIPPEKSCFRRAIGSFVVAGRDQDAFSFDAQATAPSSIRKQTPAGCERSPPTYLEVGIRIRVARGRRLAYSR